MVDVSDVSSLPDAVAVAKTDLANAEHDLANAVANERLAGHWIDEAAVHSSNIDAVVDLKIKKDNIELEREEGIRTNLLACLTSQAEWELVSACPLPSNPQKIILVFKRPIK